MGSQGIEPGDAAEQELAAQLAYVVGDYGAARAHLESAFRIHRQSGAVRRAARNAMDLAEIHQSVYGNEATSQGWLARARRLLETVGSCVEWGYLELAIMACERPDVGELERSADRALEVAGAFADPDLEIRALADSGLALVSQGHLDRGFVRLDEALAAITAGEARQPETAAKSFCSLLSSCDRAGDVRRAEEWTRLVDQMVLQPLGGGPVVLSDHCRLAYGSVLVGAGRWAEAEALLVPMAAGGVTKRPHLVETLARLADLRLLQGRLHEAAELVAPYRDRVAMRGPVARLHLRRGELDAAVAIAELGLRDLIDDLLRGGPLLGVIVQAELARDDPEAAERAAARLDTLAAASDSAVLRADAALARGRIATARGDHVLAVAELAEAHRGLERAARPTDAATARLELAAVYRDAGDVAAAVAEARSAHAVLAPLGAAAADQAAALLRSLGVAAPPVGDGSPSVEGLTRREAEVLDLVMAGMTNAEIAERLYISPKTAEHHVSRVLTKLGVRTRAEAAAVAAAAAARRVHTSGAAVE
jgi:DNA-binding CsgD family transcriptional regulator/predicted metal-dependent hydrolase